MLLVVTAQIMHSLQAFFVCLVGWLVFCCFVFFAALHACEILLPPPGIKSMRPAVEAQILNHWTARESLTGFF